MWKNSIEFFRIPLFAFVVYKLVMLCLLNYLQWYYKLLLFDFCSLQALAEDCYILSFLVLPGQVILQDTHAQFLPYLGYFATHIAYADDA